MPSPTAAALLETSVLGLVAALSLGAADFLAALATRRFGALVVGFVATLIAFLAYGVAWVPVSSYRPTQTPHVGYLDFAPLLYGSLLVAVATLLLYSGLKKGPVGIVSALSATYPIIVVVVGVVAFSTPLSDALLLSIVAVVAGVCLCCVTLARVTARSLAGPALGLGAALAWGTGYPLVAQGALAIGWRLATLVELLTMAVLLGAAVLLQSVRSRGSPYWAVVVRQAPRNRFVIGCGLVQVVGIVALNLGLEAGAAATSTVILASLSSCYPMVTMVLARLGLGEVLTHSQIVGVFVTVSGVAAMTVAETTP